jgi:hypothetical protein
MQNSSTVRYGGLALKTPRAGKYRNEPSSRRHACIAQCRSNALHISSSAILSTFLAPKLPPASWPQATELRQWWGGMVALYVRHMQLPRPPLGKAVAGQRRAAVSKRACRIGGVCCALSASKAQLADVPAPATAIRVEAPPECSTGVHRNAAVSLKSATAAVESALSVPQIIRRPGEARAARGFALAGSTE